MTGYSIKRFHRHGKEAWTLDTDEPRLLNWPVVYMLDDEKCAYVGESLNVRNRFSQHLASEEKQHLTFATIVLDDTFNKSAALDLESHLVRLLAGDENYEVLNRNTGIVDADYFDRAKYRKRFGEIFDEMRKLGIFTRSVREIENSELFRLSPFKALTPDQEQAIKSYLVDLLASLERGDTTRSVIQGDPGTGKTIVGIYLAKLIADLSTGRPDDAADEHSVVADPYVAERVDLLRDFKIGFVVPQQALRGSIKRVFGKTPGLSEAMVLTPFQVGKSEERFDLLIVDETHRLSRRAAQASGPQNKEFVDINKRLFGEDDYKFSQLDWISAQSKHQVFLLDAAQSVRPADLPGEVLDALVGEVTDGKRFYPLSSQMRVLGGSDYIAYMRGIFSADPPTPRGFSGYDLRWFEDLGEMEKVLSDKESRGGLARMLAGYAWKWKSKKNPDAFDIEIGDFRRKWNVAEKDWVLSPGAPEEVGSIHTIQGYDLNYAGVIIGSDLRYDPEGKRLYVDKSSYFDARGKQQSKRYGFETTADDLLRYVVSIYVVLLTRGIRGTYVYVCDPDLRDYLRPFLTVGSA